MGDELVVVGPDAPSRDSGIGLDKLGSDVLVNFGSTQAESDAFLPAGYAHAMPQVRGGAVASPVGEDFIASVSPPTGLSLTWASTTMSRSSRKRRRRRMPTISARIRADGHPRGPRGLSRGL